MKTPAFSLQGTIMVMLFASIVIGSVILMNRFNQHIYAHAYLQSTLLSDIESATSIAMSNNEQLVYEDSIQLNYHEQIHFARKAWGLFDVISAKGKYGNNKAEKVGLYAKTISKEKLPTFHIIGGHSNLSVAGKSILKGALYCPNKRIKRAYIEGKSYEGKELYEGKLHDAKEKSVSINIAELQSRMNALQKRIVMAKKVPISALSDSLGNAFSSECISMSSADVIQINNQVVGNVLIHSEKEIVVEQAAYLENCILSAPSIIVKSTKPIRFQAFASNTILVEEGAIVQFPSALMCIGNQESTIKFEENVNFVGNILAVKEQLTFPATLIQFSSGCKVMGLIHSNSCVQALGQISGSVACQKFILKTKSSTYENVLLDTELSQDGFPVAFPCGYLKEERYELHKLIEL